ncbi:VMAP-C domain-containing protein [Streptomyces sp. NBC_01465]|uniref:VMAP-C domain-containing protein n=1 Tax=Streptomyces sp. NBC_01465 TaxID=2903878 RepID=UPI002E320DC7|nr:trypsin-like peptidase domain-containing protein [Streptomyces sp. NBC_01465]
MSSPSWHARVECDGIVRGAGFLVSDRQVVTCAHVVQYDGPVSVTFPGGPGIGRVLATVVRGPWAGKLLDPGDVAVLVLERPVPVEPAAFTLLNETVAGPSPRIVCYGFPDGYDEGTLSELSLVSAQLISDEWAQVTAWKEHGQGLASGFSGAAAMLAEGGKVIGMIASQDPDAHNGRIIPAQVMGRHLPELADLIPTPGYGPAEKHWLRELIRRASGATYDLDRLFANACGAFGFHRPADRFRTLWEAVWYLLSESPPRAASLPLADLTEGLARLVGDDSLSTDLRAWSRAHRRRFDAAAPASVDSHWAPILVEIRRSGADRNSLLAEVSAFRNGHGQLVAEDRLTRAQLRDWVLDKIEAAYGELDLKGKELVAFVLPRGWLNEPVDQWVPSRGREKPLGCKSPLVVMDLERRTNHRLQRGLRQIWASLDAHQTSALYRIDCDSAYQPDVLSVELQDVLSPVGFARPPRAPRDKRLYGAALDAPAPIVLWSRTACNGAGCAQSCSGSDFLDLLAEHLEGLAPSDVPSLIWTLRKQAFTNREPVPHWAQGLSLIWEDPRWFPGVQPIAASPVG